MPADSACALRQVSTGVAWCQNGVVGVDFKVNWIALAHLWLPIFLCLIWLSVIRRHNRRGLAWLARFLTACTWIYLYALVRSAEIQASYDPSFVKALWYFRALLVLSIALPLGLGIWRRTREKPATQSVPPNNNEPPLIGTE